MIVSHNPPFRPSQEGIGYPAVALSVGLWCAGENGGLTMALWTMSLTKGLTARVADVLAEETVSGWASSSRDGKLQRARSALVALPYLR